MKTDLSKGIDASTWNDAQRIVDNRIIANANSKNRPDPFRHCVVVPASWDNPDADEIEPGTIVYIEYASRTEYSKEISGDDPIVKVSRITSESHIYNPAVAASRFTRTSASGMVAIRGTFWARVQMEDYADYDNGSLSGRYRPGHLPEDQGVLISSPSGAFRVLMYPENYTRFGTEIVAPVKFPVGDYLAPFHARLTGIVGSYPAYDMTYSFEEVRLGYKSGGVDIQVATRGRTGTAYNVPFYDRSYKSPDDETTNWLPGTGISGVVVVYPYFRILDGEPTVMYLFNRTPARVGPYTHLRVRK